MATLTAPVRGSGSCPAWMARVAKPCFAKAGCLVVIFLEGVFFEGVCLALVFLAGKGMSPQKWRVGEENFSQNGKALLLSYPPPPLPRSNKLKDLECRGAPGL